MTWNHKSLVATLLISASVPTLATTTAVNTGTPSRYGVFDVPLVPLTSVTETQQQALSAAISAYQQAQDAANLAPLEQYLASDPQSPWQAALWLNMALVNERDGYFSHSLQLFEQAYQAARQADTEAERAIGIQALGHLLDLHSRFGHEQALSRLLSEVSEMPDPVELASISEQISAARSGLWQIQHTPEAALRCGIVALQNLLATQPGHQDMIDHLDQIPAGHQGTTLAQLLTWANEAQLPAQAVQVHPGDEIPVPSVMHWTLGHYATIVSEQNGRYQVQDPTLGTNLWMSRDALEQESSGDYLALIDTNTRHHWTPLSPQQAQTVIGAGYTSGSDDTQTSGCDDTDGGSGGGWSCGGGMSGDRAGMPQYTVHSMLVSLSIQDTPVIYTPPVGPSVPLTVTYSQRDAYQPTTFTYANLGPKWTFNGISYVQDNPQSAGSNVYVYLMGGGIRNFSDYDSSTGIFGAEQRTGAYLVKVSDSPVRYERRMSGGQIYVYEQSDGQTAYPRKVFLTEIIDAQGNSATFTYDDQLRLTTMTDALGQETALSYDNADDPLLITGITDPFGRSSVFDYDDEGRLDSITDAIGMTTTFSYDSGTFINAMTTPYGTTSFSYGESGTTRWLESTDPNGETERVEYRHGASGIPFSETLAPEGMTLFNRYINARNTFYWDKEAMKRAPGDYTQARIRHWFHLRTNTSKTTGVLESVKNPLENRIWYNYPGQSSSLAEGTLDKPSLIGRVMPDGTTQLTQNSYNDQGNLTKTIDPLGRERVYSYADNGIDLLEVQRKTADGYETTATFTYDDQHRPLTHTDALGHTTTYTYNAAGQRTSITNALSQTTTYEYNDLGYLTAIIDANGVTQAQYTYDAMGRMATQTNADDYTLSYSYDNLDRLIRTTYPDGSFDETTWDKLDTVQQTTRYGDSTTYEYDSVRHLISSTDPSSHITQYSYFSNGDIESITDGNGNTKTLEQDIQGRVTKEIQADSSETSYSYDGIGRQTSITNTLSGVTTNTYTIDEHLSSVTDPNGYTTVYSYNSYTGNMEQQDSPDTGITSFSYDSADRLISRVDAKGQTTTYTYDELNRLINVEYSDGETTSYIYDSGEYGIGRLSSITDSSGVTAFVYNVRGQLIQRTRTASNGAELTVSYRYNPDGQPSQMVYPSGTIIEYHYIQERLSGITVNGQPLIDNVQYEAFGPIANWTWGNGQSNQRSFDDAGQLQSYTLGDDTRAITYDSVGNITAINGPSFEQYFTYDGLDRLLSASADDFDLSYGYDANGNRVEEQDGNAMLAYTVDAASNRLLAIDDTNLSYDENGNLLNDDQHSYAFNARNQLVSVDNDGTAYYTYDNQGLRTSKKITTSYILSADLNGDGNVNYEDIHILQGYIFRHESPLEADLNQDGRVDHHDIHCVAEAQENERDHHQSPSKQTPKKPEHHSFFGHWFGWWPWHHPKPEEHPACQTGTTIETTVVTQFLYDGPNLLGEYNTDGTAKQEIIWLDNQPVGLLQNGDVYAIETDQLNTPRTISDKNGTVVWRWDGKPFGDTDADSDPDGDGNDIIFNLRFAGQYWDQETKNHYNYYRYYNPKTGRYLQSDPIGLQGGLNTYTYVDNNPLYYADPTGLLSTLDLCANPANAEVCAAAGIIPRLWAKIIATSKIVQRIGVAAPSIPKPSKQKGKYVCTCRAQCRSDCLEPGADMQFGFATAVGNDLAATKNEAKKGAEAEISCQGKHTTCKCVDPKGAPIYE